MVAPLTPLLEFNRMYRWKSRDQPSPQLVADWLNSSPRRGMEPEFDWYLVLIDTEAPPSRNWSSSRRSRLLPSHDGGQQGVEGVRNIYCTCLNQCHDMGCRCAARCEATSAAVHRFAYKDILRVCRGSP